MPFRFSYVCDLFEELEKLVVRDAPLRNYDLKVCGEEGTLKWLQQHKKHLNEFSSDGPIVINMLRPDRMTDRDFGWDVDSFELLIARVLQLTKPQVVELQRWRCETHTGDLAAWVARIMKNDGPPTVRSVTEPVNVEEIDRFMVCTACRNKGSSAETRSLASGCPSDYDPIEKLTDIYKRLQPREAKWLTRLLLKTTAPVVVPFSITVASFECGLPNCVNVNIELPNVSAPILRVGETGIVKALMSNNTSQAVPVSRSHGTLRSPTPSRGSPEVDLRPLRGGKPYKRNFMSMNRSVSPPQRSGKAATASLSKVQSSNTAVEVPAFAEPNAKRRRMSREPSTSPLVFPRGVLRPIRRTSISRNMNLSEATKGPLCTPEDSPSSRRIVHKNGVWSDNDSVKPDAKKIQVAGSVTELPTPPAPLKTESKTSPTRRRMSPIKAVLPEFPVFRLGYLQPSQPAALNNSLIAPSGDGVKPDPPSVPKTVRQEGPQKSHSYKRKSSQSSIRQSTLLKLPVFQLGLLQTAQPPTLGASHATQYKTPQNPSQLSIGETVSNTNIIMGTTSNFPKPPAAIQADIPPIPSTSVDLTGTHDHPRSSHKYLSSALVSASVSVPCSRSTSTNQCPLQNCIFLLQPTLPENVHKHLITTLFPAHSAPHVLNVSDFASPKLPRRCQHTGKRFRKIILIEPNNTETIVPLLKQVQDLELTWNRKADKDKKMRRKEWVECYDWRLLPSMCRWEKKWEEMQKDTPEQERQKKRKQELSKVWKKYWMCII